MADLRVLRLTKNTESKVELAFKMLQVYCVLRDIKVSDTDLQVMAYILVYRYSRETKQLIVRSRILRAGSLENTLTKLRKKGLLVKIEYEGTRPIDDLDFIIENKMGIILKLENV